MGNSQSCILNEIFSLEDVCSDVSLLNKIKNILENINQTDNSNLQTDDIKSLLITNFFAANVFTFNLFFKNTYEKNNFTMFTKELTFDRDRKYTERDKINVNSYNYFLFEIDDKLLQHSMFMFVDNIQNKIIFYEPNYNPLGVSVYNVIYKYFNQVFTNLDNKDFDILLLSGNQYNSSFCRAFVFNCIESFLREFDISPSKLNYKRIIKELDEITPNSLCKNLYRNIYNNLIKDTFSLTDFDRRIVLDFVSAYKILYIINDRKNVINYDQEFFLSKEKRENEFFMFVGLNIILNQNFISNDKIRQLVYFIIRELPMEDLKTTLCSYTSKPFQQEIDSIEEQKKIDMAYVKKFYRDENTKISLLKGIISYDKEKFNRSDSTLQKYVLKPFTDDNKYITFMETI